MARKGWYEALANALQKEDSAGQYKGQYASALVRPSKCNV